MSRTLQAPGASLLWSGPMIQTPAVSTAQESKRARFQFSLRTLILLVTLAAISLGLLRAAVVLGAVFVLAAVPALVRTVRGAARDKTADRPAGLLSVVGRFFGSVIIVLSLMAASVCTLLAACLASALFLLTVAASTCGFLGAYFGRISGGARRLQRHTLLATASCGALNRRLFRWFCASQG